MKILPNAIAVLENDTHISKWVEETGQLCLDKTVELSILPLIKEGNWVVDGGAFCGDHTIAYAKKVGPTGKVFAFEPNPQAFKCLEWNMRNYPNVICQQMALSDRQKRRGMQHDANAGAAFVTGDTGDVHCTALDSIPLERLDYVKLDVEGHELFALQGMRQTIAKCRPTIVLEINHGALARNAHDCQGIFSFLANAGYWYENLTGGPMPTDSPQFDLLAKPLLTKQSETKSKT